MADTISGEKVGGAHCTALLGLTTQYVLQVGMIMDAFNSLADRQGVVATRNLGAVMKRLGENPTQVQQWLGEGEF